MDLCFPSKLGSILKEKNLLPYGSKFFSFKVDPNFRKGFIVHWEANRKSQKLLVFEKMVIKHGGSCSHFNIEVQNGWPGRVAQSVGHLSRKSGVLGSIPGLATYFRFSFRFFKKGSCQLLAKVCARRTG